MNVIQQIFRDHADGYLARFGARMPGAHRKVISAIGECRSGQRGHHLFACPDCGKTHAAKSSCGNRHCPVCQHEKGVNWVYRQQLRLLPCNYFMATFTIPEELRAVARSNQAVVYKAMFDCAAASLRTLEADKRFVGCKVAGFFGVLHTWGRQLQYHPHVHFVIPGCRRGTLSGSVAVGCGPRRFPRACAGALEDVPRQAREGFQGSRAFRSSVAGGLVEKLGGTLQKRR